MYGTKYSGKGHKDRNRHKSRMKMRGKARLVYVTHEGQSREGESPGTRRRERDRNTNRQAGRQALLLSTYSPSFILKRMRVCSTMTQATRSTNTGDLLKGHHQPHTFLTFISVLVTRCSDVCANFPRRSSLCVESLFTLFLTHDLE